MDEVISNFGMMLQIAASTDDGHGQADERILRFVYGYLRTEELQAQDLGAVLKRAQHPGATREAVLQGELITRDHSRSTYADFQVVVAAIARD